MFWKKRNISKLIKQHEILEEKIRKLSRMLNSLCPPHNPMELDEVYATRYHPLLAEAIRDKRELFQEEQKELNL